MWKFTRKINVPASNDSKQQDVAAGWLVRWESINDATIISRRVELGKPQVEVFATEAAAQQFVSALKNAYALTRCKADQWIEMKQQSA